jgi:muramidase (phage lysozyme)
MSTYAGKDDCTDIILDFIAGGIWGDKLGNPIGESDGNYNAYFGNAHSKLDLSAKSLGEIYTFQNVMLSRDARSTAIGRYQFLRGTLKGLQSKHKMDNSVLFTPAVQDEFAVDLLVGRGYKLWWRGQLGHAGFAHLLSCEWASLPDPENDGRSHYDGDSAGNHASTTLDHVYAMLIKAALAKPEA